MKTYKYLADFDGHKAGDISALDPALFNIDEMIAGGVIEEASEDADAEAKAEEEAAAKAQAEKDAEEKARQEGADAINSEAEASAAYDAPRRMYRGQEVISIGTRELNDKTYHTVRLADGSTEDLTDEQFALEVTELSN